MLAIFPLVNGVNQKTLSLRIEDNYNYYISKEINSTNTFIYQNYLKESYFCSNNKTSSKNVEPIKILNYIGPMDSSWPMKCHDLHHTSQSPYSTADNPYIEKWRFHSTGWVEDSPVIANDGTIYFGGGYEGLSWYLIAINPNGTVKWRYKTFGLMLGSSPAIDEDGTIYIGNWEHYLYAITPNGTKKWKVDLGANIACSPVISEDGTIYIGSFYGDIYAINQNGTEKWRYRAGTSITGGPAVGDDGTIYCGSGDKFFYALNPNGTLKWRYKTGDIIKGPPSIADDGTIYIGSFDDYLYAFYPNGTLRWKCKVGTGTETNPSIAYDGTIYVGSPDGHLYAVNPNGTMKWSFSVKGNIHQSSPTISADGTIYFGTDDSGYIYAVNPDGTEKWKKKIAKKWVESSPSIAEDGTIYIGSTYDMARGYIHAFGSVDSNQPPETPTISGKTSGKIGENHYFTFRAVDIDRNPISFYIDWGDGDEGWTFEYASYEYVRIGHSWSKPNTYTIRAKAKDVMGEESDWTEFEIKISIPRTRTSLNAILDIFSILYRIKGLVN